ncbi:MAG TPA: neuraminidase-like domain-containing protein [Thermoanaerobaculia bacterium]|nr:neuraminidase-like domain-containing protein [Thermoanaerobaculia bacterium]
MLSLDFVNPGGAIQIHHLDGSCDTAQKRLQTLDAAALDRIHRFLRLWKKLGWKMWEVDLAIARLGAGDIDPTFAANMRPFLKLQKRFKTLSVEQLLSFWGDMNTKSKFTAAFKKPEPSLYEKTFLSRRVMNPLDPAFAIDVVSGAPVETIDDHLAPIYAATRVREAELETLRALAQPGTIDPWLQDNLLSLANLSFLHRHALLAKALRIKIADWATLLFVLQRDVFASPAETLAVVELVDRIKASGLTIDAISYILAANLVAKGADTEKNAIAQLTALRAALQTIAGENDPADLPTSADELSAILLAKLQVLGWPADSAQAAVDAITGTLQSRAVAPSLPGGFAFPDPIMAAMPGLSYDDTAKAIGFTGFMTDAERATLLAVAANPDYQQAIQDLHAAPRLLLKLLDPSFRAPLDELPAGISFPTQLAPELAATIAYDTDARELTFAGVMSDAEKSALDALSADGDYRNAVLALYNAPRSGVFAPEELWLAPGDLAFPLADETDPALDNRPANLAEAARRILAALERELSRLAVIDHFANALRVSPAVSETLVTSYPLFGGKTLLELYTDPAFLTSSAALAPATHATEITGWFWIHRAALLLRTLKVTGAELEWMIRTHAQSGVLDLATLPLVFDDDPPAVASIDRLLDLSDLMQFHHARSDEFVSLLDMIDSLIDDPGYTTSLFGAETELLTEWPAADVETLATSLDIAYPAGFATWAGWKRLRQAFPMLTRLNASAQAMLPLAGPIVTLAESASVKQLLRSKFEEEQFLELSKNVQDILRERKRDSLVAYLLLTQPMPADAPTNKWENANDLFAYYLVDVEMCSCQLSSRIVQASGAAQLFVQRCFMGLEPKVRVSVDDDDAWLQWQWMKYYRVWEANRRVFAYPENYAEPELRRDKSEIFRSLEEELLQGEVNRDNVETAFLHYLERLEDVAQLEIAGTWQEDSRRTLHVFGRTPGSEPRTYYYRKFIDRRRWTGWTKVECDIKSDYVVPLIANDRLHLVWPEFREEPQQPSSTNVPNAGENNVTLDKPQKRMQVHLAVTDLRSGKWTPKRVTQDPIATGYFSDSNPFDRSRYAILPLDFSSIAPALPFLLLVIDTQTNSQDLFELAGCRGYPEPYRPETAEQNLSFLPILTRFERDRLSFMKNAETSAQLPGNELVPQYNLFMKQKILNLTPGFFRIHYPHYMSFFDKLYFMLLLVFGFQLERRYLVPLGTFYDWFYADKLRTFFVTPKLVSEKLGGAELQYPEIVALWQELLDLLAGGDFAGIEEKLKPYLEAAYEFRLDFDTFYHPLTCLFTKELYARGVEGLMARKTQFAEKPLDFAGRYAPTAVVQQPYPREVVDFEPDGAYSLYNWELFFHAPLMIATRLSKDQRFEDAMRWFHFIFDPTGGNDKDPVTNLPAPSPQKYWITKPFFQRQAPDYEQQRLENLMHLLASDPQNPTPAAEIQKIIDAVVDWRRNPFDPHVVAQYREVAYQKMTVMKYVDNLIAWGDERFRMDTMESVNEATQLYVLAAEILGPRPRRVPPVAKPPAETFSELQKKLDAFSNALVDFENVIPPLPPDDSGTSPVPSVPSLLYFCIPPNDQMLRYWDTVADRLYKIRHCMNIEGVVRQLSLFAPPIDPAALVKAVAGGLDIGAALADLNAPLPHYRFQTMLQKANELVGDLKSLGAALLAALEKKDAEALARLRQGQEMSVLKAARDVRQKQIDDAQLAIDGLRKNRELITIRRDFYASREFMNGGETAALALNAVSLGIHTAGSVLDILGGGIALIPDFKVGASGFGGSPHLTVDIPSGKKISDGLALGARAAYQLSTILDKSAGIATTMAGYERRSEEWENNVALANKELEQMDKQIAAAELKKTIAEKELENHDLNIENSKAVDTFMREKYTNQELYQWMITQISQTYFQTYKLAYDVAKRAERCYRYEIGVQDSSFIQYGYWDSMKSGLQAGEKLQLDLRRLENAYLDGNRRKLELTKSVSLAMTNPAALLALKEKGVCIVDLPEELFDLDYPGHYFREIKSVSITIPCVAGPHTTIACSLRLLKNRVRINTLLGAQYEHNNDEGVLTDDDRFRESHVRVKAIATSTAQNDSGLFELNFRDDRYLPFEGAGAISTWQIELTQAPELRQFSYDSISDAILQVRYTALEDAGQFKAAAVEHLKNVIAEAAGRMPLRRMFDLKREFPTEWYAFFHPTGTPDKTLQIQIARRHFPYFAQHADLEIGAVWLFVRSDNGDPLVASLELPGAPAETINIPAATNADEFQTGSLTDLAELLDETQPLRLRLRKDPGTFNAITDAEIEEAFLIVQYTT